MVHVFCTSKNAADDKLRQWYDAFYCFYETLNFQIVLLICVFSFSIRRFTENVKLPCAVMLVSSDVNFAPDLSDLKNRKKVHVVLVHGPLASETLLLCANERFLYDEMLNCVPTSPHQQKVNLF